MEVVDGVASGIVFGDIVGNTLLGIIGQLIQIDRALEGAFYG